MGYDIICAVSFLRFVLIYLFRQEKLSVCDRYAALPACDLPAAVRFVRILHIVQDIPDRCPDRSSLPPVERHQSCSRHRGITSLIMIFRDSQSRIPVPGGIMRHDM